MADIAIGTRLEKTLLVDNEVAINFLGLVGARVLATPWMYGLVLWNAMERYKPLKHLGFDS
jgi:predicted thioesterase